MKKIIFSILCITTHLAQGMNQKTKITHASLKKKFNITFSDKKCKTLYSSELLKTKNNKPRAHLNCGAKSLANLNDFLENLLNKKNTSNNEKKTILNFIKEKHPPSDQKKTDCSCLQNGLTDYLSCCGHKTLLKHFKIKYFYPKDYYLIETNSIETKQKFIKISKENELNNFITKYEKTFAEILKKSSLIKQRATLELTRINCIDIYKSALNDKKNKFIYNDIIVKIKD